MIKKTFLLIHKWLGLVSGLVVFIVSITGCINVFSDELKEFFYRDRLFTEKVEGKPLPFSFVLKQARHALGPEYRISRCEIYPGAGRTWVFRASSTNANAFGHWNYYKYYFRVYVNPYNGKVVYVEDARNEFFQLVLSMHMHLLLGAKASGVITGVSTLCFFVLLLSGLVLWWPKSWKRKLVRRALLLKRGVGKKRLNYDIHNVGGFYILIPALLISLTGLVFAFDWADQSVQYIANGGRKEHKREIPVSSPNESYHFPAVDRAIQNLLAVHSSADVFSIRFREKNTAPLDVQVRIAENRTHEFKWYYFDRNTGELLLKYGNEDLKGGEKLRSMNYDLHTGAFAGIPTKVLAFLVSLVCASLPVTGFIIWYNKGAKKKKKASSPYLKKLLQNH